MTHILRVFDRSYCSHNPTSASFIFTQLKLVDGPDFALLACGQVLGIKDNIANNIDTFLNDEKYISEVRIEFVKLLSALGSHDSGKPKHSQEI